MLKAGADIDKALTIEGQTPLYIAAKKGYDKVVELLLKADADIDEAENSCGITPLFIAAENGYYKVVKMLLAAGADKDNATTSDGFHYHTRTALVIIKLYYILGRNEWIQYNSCPIQLARMP